MKKILLLIMMFVVVVAALSFTACGDSGEFEFKLQENDTYAISAKVGKEMDGDIVIPATYEGKAVTVVGGFSGRGIKTVSIPNSVISISDSAFLNCKSLTGIVIPDSVTNISQNAFSGCQSLTEIVIPDSVRVIGSYAFSGCTNLNSVTLGAGLTNIDLGVFNGCSSLNNITIPSNITRIETKAFKDCTALKNATFAVTSGWKVRENFSTYSISSSKLSDSESAAKCLIDEYCDAQWFRGDSYWG